MTRSMSYDTPRHKKPVMSFFQQGLHKNVLTNIMRHQEGLLLDLRSVTAVVLYVVADVLP